VTAAELDATPGADVVLCRPSQAQPSPLIDTAPVMWDACELDEGLADLPQLFWERDRHGAVMRAVPKSEELPGESKSRSAKSKERCPPRNVTRSDQRSSAQVPARTQMDNPMSQAQQDQATHCLLADPIRAEPDQTTHQKLEDLARGENEFHKAEAALQDYSDKVRRVRSQQQQSQ